MGTALCCEAFESREEKIAKTIERDGHKCVFYLETLPPQISWCGNSEKCELSEYVTPKEIYENFFKIRRVFI